ncbi:MULTISPECIES: hypothetical protein [Kocuria]|uniref:Uncharacterized protein n=1 Tax=Kocuria subflava TaxID=1736139 RepID=A0A846TTE5_9MICC|nr:MULTISPECIES: hypothetical protein [Kocuria]NKE10059.1 hypothetical protein [Kocuria subflava]
MRGNEERVIQAFCAFLDEQEWVTEREIGFVDAVAQKDGQRTFAEAKGRTVAIGLDEDTMFGQLPRRMRDECPGPDTRLAVVVPTHASAAAEGVPAGVRRELSIDLYVVGHDWSVSIRA